MDEIKEYATGKETREGRFDSASKFFEAHGLRCPEAAAGETRGVGSLALERNAAEVSNRKNAAAEEAKLAGKDKEAAALTGEATDKEKEVKWTQNMRAINFNEPVQRKTVEAGTVLYRNEIVQARGIPNGGETDATRKAGSEKYTKAEGGAGEAAAAGLRWFCGEESSPGRLGMVREGGMETGGNRFTLKDGTVLERKAFVATRDVEALESTASDICGFRSEDRSELLYFGGDRQICVSDRSAMKSLEGMSLAEEIQLRRRKGKADS